MPRRQCHGAEQAVMPSSPYDFTLVPNCEITEEGLQGSFLEEVVSRSDWVSAVPELVGLSHEAADRRGRKTGSFHGIHHDHAEAERLSFSFIAERAQTDDPIEGFMIRTKDKTRRLQGFLWFTNFTTWTHFFRWDSLADKAELHGRAQRDGISWDSDGSLSSELEMQHRDGDPNDQGVIWPRVAEIALVGALECGGFLVQLALEALESSSAYDFVVVQATESSAGFYDRMGFKRVGALAKYVTSDVAPHQARTVAYRHWAYPDEDVSKMDSSIMMALKLHSSSLVCRIMPNLGGIWPNRARFLQRVPSRGVLANAPKYDCTTPLKANPGNCAASSAAGSDDISGGSVCANPHRLLVEASPAEAGKDVGGRRSQACRPWVCYGNPVAVSLTPKRVRAPASNQLNRSSSSLVQNKARAAEATAADKCQPVVTASGRAIRGPGSTSTPKRKPVSSPSVGNSGTAAELVGTSCEVEAEAVVCEQQADVLLSSSSCKRPKRESALRSIDFARLVGRRFYDTVKKQAIQAKKQAAALRSIGVANRKEHLKQGSGGESGTLTKGAHVVNRRLGSAINRARGRAVVPPLSDESKAAGHDSTSSCSTVGGSVARVSARRANVNEAPATNAATVPPIQVNATPTDSCPITAEAEPVTSTTEIGSFLSACEVPKKKKSGGTRVLCGVSMLASRLRRQRAPVSKFKFSIADSADSKIGEFGLHFGAMSMAKRRSGASLSASDLRARCQPGVKSWTERNARNTSKARRSSDSTLQSTKQILPSRINTNTSPAKPSYGSFPSFPFVCEEDGPIAKFAVQPFSCPFTTVDGIIFATAGYAAVAPYEGGKILLQTIETQSKSTEDAESAAQGQDNLEELWNKLSCEKCGRTDQEDKMILCDTCDGGWHIHCLAPPLLVIPDDDWFCQQCAVKKCKGDSVSNGAASAAISENAVEQHDENMRRSTTQRQRNPVARFKFRREAYSTISSKSGASAKVSEKESVDSELDELSDHETPLAEEQQKATQLYEKPSATDKGGEEDKRVSDDFFWRDLKCETLQRVCQDLALRFDNVNPTVLVDKIISRFGKAVPDGEDLKLLRMLTLRSICSDAALAVGGSKNEVSSRLIRFLSSSTSSSVSSTDSSDELADTSTVPIREVSRTVARSDQMWQQWPCDGCGSSDREEEMILCDDCDAGWHLDCLNPALSTVPDGDWFCPGCSLRRPRNGTKQSNCHELAEGKFRRPDGERDFKRSRTCFEIAFSCDRDPRASKRQRAPVSRFKFNSLKV